VDPDLAQYVSKVIFGVTLMISNDPDRAELFFPALIFDSQRLVARFAFDLL
jgi:hypothetical protein